MAKETDCGGFQFPEKYRVKRPKGVSKKPTSGKKKR